MNDVITIGDALITFDPKSIGRLRHVHTFERKIGGAELNFIIGCARLGLKSGFISRLGKDEFGRFIYNSLRGEGIDVSQIQTVKGYPTSVYFKEIMADGSGRNFYYREKSPTSTMLPADLDKNYFKQAKVLHITGVFPAVCDQNIRIIEEAIKMAKQNGLMISFDPNIRFKLWGKEKAREVLTSFLPHVDIMLTGEEEAGFLLDIKNPEEIVEKLKSYDISHIAIKRGEKGAIGFHDGRWIESDAVKSRKVVDTVGAGDGFNAGYIYGILNNWDLKQTLHFANAIGSMVVGVYGDNEGLPYYEDVLDYLGESDNVER